ncbi:MAG: O-antigen ligase family protein [Bacilli bacterium]|nr:O-antigen ligase family protein [Bacilli bacterium]
MNKLKKAISIFSFFFMTILIVNLTFFFLEQSIITKVTPGYYFGPISLPNQTIIATMIVTLISSFSIYFVRRIRLSVNGVIIITILIVFFIVMTINILTIPEIRTLPVKFFDGTINDVILTLAPGKRITAILTLAVNIAFFYFIVIALPNHKHFLSITKFFIAVIVLVSIGAIVYSFITEWDVIVDLVSGGYASFTDVPTSFFNNRNPYASFLLSSQVMAVFLYYLTIKNKRRIIYFLLQIPLMFGIFLTFSKTNIALSLLLFIFVFYRNLWSMAKKKQYKRLTILTVLSSSFIVTIIFFRVIPTLQETLFGDFLKKAITTQVLEEAGKTFASRVGLWTYAFSLIVASPVTFLIGDGPHISRYFYQMRIDQELGRPNSMGLGDYHNGFVEVFHTFGLLGFIAYVSMFFVILFILIRRRKANKALAFFTFVSLLIFLVRSQFESLSLLLFKSEGIMASFTVILPFLYLNKLAHKRGHGKEIIKNAD